MKLFAVHLRILVWLGVCGAGGAAGAAPDAGAAGIVVFPGRATTVVIEDVIGHPVEREADFVAAAPSYRRAIASDREQRWAEAVGFYQQALIEVAAAAQVAPPQQLEAVAFKLDLERRRSRTLAEDAASEQAPAGAQRPPRAPAAAKLLPMERARLLRQKLMAVRAATGAAPATLRSATLAALDGALKDAERGAAARDPRAPAASEVRLLLCATQAVAGEREAARLQLARVGAADRSDPTRALTLAACQAALGYRDDALASLAVATNRLGPSSRFLPGPSREIQSANDWDPLRRDPRFARIFR